MVRQDTIYGPIGHKWSEICRYVATDASIRTSMRRHCLSSRRGGPSVVEASGFCPSRYASIRAVSESTLFGDSVHYEIRLGSGCY